MGAKTEGSAVSAQDRAALVECLREAERGNRGEVRVHFERKCPEKFAAVRAKQLFASLGMHRTQADTGVLLYVALEDRKVSVFAGAGIHGAAKPEFWQRVADAVALGFSRNAPVDGFREALRELGELLRASVPGDDEAGNELPDEVSES